MKGLAVPVALHVVLPGTLRNVKRVAVPVILHVVLHGLGFKVYQIKPSVWGDSDPLVWLLPLSKLRVCRHRFTKKKARGFGSFPKSNEIGILTLAQKRLLQFESL